MARRTWILWGTKLAHESNMPEKISAGTLAECRKSLKTREREGWTGLVICKQGDSPLPFDLPVERDWYRIGF